MSISVDELECTSDLLERSLELYRDLSVALRERIVQINTSGGLVDCGKDVEAVRSHHKALQTVLEIEAGLVKRSRTWRDGAGGELDLEAARNEIVARLAVWSAKE